jgi:hypothetical protein
MTRPTFPFPVLVMMALTLACGSSGHLLGGGGQGDDAGSDGSPADAPPSGSGGSGGGGGAAGVDGGVVCGATVCAVGLVCCTACDGSKSCGQTCTGPFCGTGGAGGTGARDGGVGGVDAAVLGTQYMCDTSTCVVGQSFCYSYLPGTAGSGGNSRSCSPTPGACATTPTCNCICPPSATLSGCMYSGTFCSCSESNGQVTLTCYGV